MAAVETPRDLAVHLARNARLLRDILLKTLETDRGEGRLREQLEASRQILVETMSEAEFADLYAQTIAYGLFAARCSSGRRGFDRRTAISALPRTHPFLRQMLTHLAGPDFDPRASGIVEQIVELLAQADVPDEVDPAIHFHESFLAEYDNRLRKARGVYYTPKSVVDYIVRSIDHLLQTELELDEGLADDVVILDPAVGTGAFLQGVIGLVRERVVEREPEGAWNSYVTEHLLPRIQGFEALPATHAIAHLNLGLFLQRSGYVFSSDQPLRVYSTNTLERARAEHDHPITVILGNPPYSGHSANKGEWINDLTDDYKKGFPELAKPGQAKWLKDDYVKFIRFAQWRIESTGCGVVAFVTNHAWIDNPTFKGMRKSLFETFDRIWILDLHGSSKRDSRDHDGGRDENVFDIQQGVAISIFVKSPKPRNTMVWHAEVRGTRECKYDFLSKHTLKTTKWVVLDMAEPDYLFVPRAAPGLQAEYDAHRGIEDLFNVNEDPAPGIVTTHDEFAISWTAEEMREKVDRLLSTGSEAEARRMWKLCSQSQWNYGRAILELGKGEWRDNVIRVLYRPFDARYTVYDRNVAVHRRARVSGHMLEAHGNLGLIVTRQQATSGSWAHCFVTTLPIESAVISNKTKEINYLFPLGSGSREVFFYAYAILSAPSYRARYAEPLRSGFPRIPFTRNARLFDSLVEHGKNLVALHTLAKKPTASSLPRFPRQGSNEISRRPSWAEERVWINADQHFEKISDAVWNFRIGAYMPAQKWLGDRRKANRSLDVDDVEIYGNIIGVLDETITIMQAIDREIDHAGGWPI